MGDTFCKRLNDSASVKNQFNAADASAEENKHIYFMLLLFTQAKIYLDMFVLYELYVEYYYYLCVIF